MTITVISRRSILKVLAASAAVPTALVSTKAFAGEGESPEFIDAVLKLGVAMGQFDDAMAAKNQAMEHFDAIAPTVPPELRAINPHLSEQGYGSPFCVAERLQDGDFQDVWRDNRPLYVMVSWGLAKQVCRSDGRTAKGKEDRRLFRAAQVYEVAVAHARSAADLDAIRETHYWAESDLDSAVTLLARTPAHTMHGALLKTQGWMAACSRRPAVRHWATSNAALIENIADLLTNGGAA